MNTNSFPGMNPFLESHWGDVRTSLTTYARDHIQPQLPSGLRARIEEYVAVESDEGSQESASRFAPDVRVIERPEAPVESAGVATASATEPIMVPRQTESETLHYIRIVDTATGHLIVASIEFVSLANKVGADGREQYLAKQRKMLAGGVNLVEIDLLRAGSWIVAVPKIAVPKECREPYRICVVRGSRPSIAEVYPTSFRQPLPIIRIPLRTGDKDVSLQLQTLIDMAYVNGRYYEDIDYRESPDPTLTGPDAERANALLRDSGLR